MEALITALFALGVIVLLEAGYWIAMSLMRWMPVLAAGVLVCWFATRHGFEPLEGMGLGVLACLIARHLVLRGANRDDYLM